MILNPKSPFNSVTVKHLNNNDLTSKVMKPTKAIEKMSKVKKIPSQSAAKYNKDKF